MGLPFPSPNVYSHLDLNANIAQTSCIMHRHCVPLVSFIAPVPCRLREARRTGGDGTRPRGVSVLLVVVVAIALRLVLFGRRGRVGERRLSDRGYSVLVSRRAGDAVQTGNSAMAAQFGGDAGERRAHSCRVLVSVDRDVGGWVGGSFGIVRYARLATRARPLFTRGKHGRSRLRATSAKRRAFPSPVAPQCPHRARRRHRA